MGAGLRLKKKREIKHTFKNVKIKVTQNNCMYFTFIGKLIAPFRKHFIKKGSSNIHWHLLISILQHELVLTVLFTVASDIHHTITKNLYRANMAFSDHRSRPSPKNGSHSITMCIKSGHIPYLQYVLKSCIYKKKKIKKITVIKLDFCKY